MFKLPMNYFVNLKKKNYFIKSDVDVIYLETILNMPLVLDNYVYALYIKIQCMNLINYSWIHIKVGLKKVMYIQGNQFYS